MAIRHPRYTLLLSVVLVLSLFLLLPDTTYNYNSFYPSSGAPSVVRTVTSDVSLPARVARGERIYQKMLAKRRGLIRKFGPSTTDVISFPEDREPWPAYTIWDFFPPAFNCPHELERIGALGDGGKWLCGLSRLESKPDCIVYSIGAAGQASFESELLARTRNCQVWGYDFTTTRFGPEVTNPHKADSDWRAYFAEPVETFYSDDGGEEVEIEGERKEYWSDKGHLLERRTHFKSWGVAGKDAPETSDTPQVYTIESLMRMNGHSHIDVLKIDMESLEFDALAAFIEAFPVLPIGQLIVELHIWNRPFDKIYQWWEALENAGMRAFMTEPNLIYQNYNRHASPELAEYSFINIKNGNVFVVDSPTESSPNMIRHGPRE
ncbi:hypothetical protein EW146_g6247 [Bondarzewia mesenterica]|uniref:Methyltransferase domain-containing protein n=1 Tax=Bondarzewia mesenterica TaxID=1095465 RepID=A0A4S4LP35_9AGAM|nr:hypothetical protein EW146_g6247 [Bondarzewia mesenterica]